MVVRPASAADSQAIRHVHEAAFPTSAEARLVEELERDGDAVISLVAEKDGAVVGHVLMSRMAADADGRTLAALGLGPVAVIPDCQGEGIGGALIEESITRARNMGTEIVFLLGEPDYYRRFGFEAALASPFSSPYAGPYFQALALGTGFLPPDAGRASYAPAFEGLE